MKSLRIILLLVAVAAFTTINAKTPKKRLADRIGVCTSVGNAAIIKAAGGNHVEENLMNFVMPDKSDAEFEKNRRAAAQSVLPIASTNCFFPGEIRLTGPDFDIEKAAAYTEIALRRAAQVGIKTTVLGSGWARSYPEGFSHEEAERQFVVLMKRLGAIAEKYGVVIAIEPLRKEECNFINTVQEGYEIAKKVKSPNVKVNADIYHMMQEGEGPQSIINAGRKYIANIHIAENTRTPPGTNGDDFTPYFRALKKIKYKGNISIECGWSTFEEQLAPSIKEIQRQLAIVYGK